jgi:hypothetical protein
MSLPAPLVPAECDLRGLLFMPLDAQRLRDSDLALFSSGDEFKAAVLLWCASWHRVPAGSLPDDDRALCRFSGLDPKAWKRAREGALRGWVKCSDGLLYHEVVAEKAREAWDGRQKYQQKREADRERLQAWRDRKQQRFETPRENASETHVETADETRFETPKTVEVREGKGILGADAPIAESRKANPKPDPALVESLWACQPICGGKRKATRPEVAKALEAALKRGGEPEQIEAAFRAYYALPGCTRDDGQYAKGAAVLLNDDKWRDFLPASVGPLGHDWPDSRWSAALTLWRTDGSWEPRLGPIPGAPGCRVPAHLVISGKAA